MIDNTPIVISPIVGGSSLIDCVKINAKANYYYNCLDYGYRLIDSEVPEQKLYSQNKPLFDVIDVGIRKICVSDRAKVVFEKLLAKTKHQFLKLLTVKGVDYYALNVLERLDCLDWTKSKYEITSKGNINFSTGDMRVILDWNKVPEDIELFRIDRVPNYIFATRRFAEKCLEHSISGIGFVPINDYWQRDPDYIPGLPILKSIKTNSIKHKKRNR